MGGGGLPFDRERGGEGPPIFDSPDDVLVILVGDLRNPPLKVSEN